MKSSTAESELKTESTFSASTKKQSTTESAMISEMYGFAVSTSYRPKVLPYVNVGCNKCLFLVPLLAHCQIGTIRRYNMITS